jgi:dTDP-4-dehydrorhamnose reductase
MTSWLVTGAAGMLGRDLVDLLGDTGVEVSGIGHDGLDITDGAAVHAAMRDIRPHVVVNCAAWTAVDDAEMHEAEATAVNGKGAANVASACAAIGARLIHLSTDYVFDGTAARPYAENDAPAPRSAYGRSKLAGEQAVLRTLPDGGYILRTAWLYGEHGPNFIRTMIRLESQRDQVRVVADQHGQPTWTGDVAKQILLLARSEAPPGIYHATNSGATTWHGLAQEVFRLLGADPARVKPITTAEYPLPAPRPAYSVLGHNQWASAGLQEMPQWGESLGRAFPRVAASVGRDLHSR